MKSERIEEIYGALDKMAVTLDPDPVSRGPQYMQDLVSLTRGYLNEVGVYIQEAHRERHRLEMAKDALETVFDARADELLVDDKRVSELPSIEDRRSMINLILKDERREIAEINGKLRAISLVEKALRFRHKELDSTMSAIRVQRSLVSMELGTGSSYGDESPTSRGSKWATKKKSSSEGEEVPGLSAEEEDDLETDLAKQMEEIMSGVPSETQSEESADEPALEPEVTPEVTPEPEATPEPPNAEPSKKAPEPEEDGTVSFETGDDDFDFDSFLVTNPEDPEEPKEGPKPALETKKTESKRAVPEEDPEVESFLEEEGEFSDFLDLI